MHRFSNCRSWLALIGMAAAFWGCGVDNPLAPETRGPNEVWIQNSQFVPASLTVSAGTRVTWINKDDFDHTIESGTRNNPTNAFPQSPLLETKNMSYSWTFSTKGRFPYFCSIHFERGEIVVQ